jgi:hypothetical protein
MFLISLQDGSKTGELFGAGHAHEIEGRYVERAGFFHSWHTFSN